MSKNDKERIEFSAIIGNPPYQVTKGGTKNVNVWQHFVKVANLCGAKWVSMIHPSRWINPKAQMEGIRDDIINSGLEKFDFYDDSAILFPATNIAGGICITNFKKDYKKDIEYYVEGFSYGKYDKNSMFFSNKYQKEVYNKLLSKYDMSKNMLQRKFGDMSFESCFGYFKKRDIDKLKKSDKGMKEPIKIYANDDFGRGSGNRKGWFYIEKALLTELPKDFTKKRKIMIEKVGQTNQSTNTVFNRLPEIVDKDCVGISYFITPENDTDYELKLIQSMFLTKTVRFLMMISQDDQCVRGFENIPDYTYFIDDMKDPKYNNKMFENRLGLLTDEYFYKKFNFSQELINYIESHISAKELV